MEEDHLDCYKNGLSDIFKSFNKYLSNNPAQKVIINADNNGTSSFMQLYSKYNFITFGINNGIYRAKNIERNGFSSSFEIFKNEKFITKINLIILGEHNIYNALAVCAALIEAGVNIDKIKEHFTSFTGMGRRFQKVGETNEIIVYDDYAHHPSEIKTTLSAIKNALKEGQRLVAVFQPHRYTRLKSLWNEFKTSFNCADILLVTDVYSAGETPIEDITSQNFVSQMHSENVKYVEGNIEQAAETIKNYLKQGDLVITLGAGSITNLGSFLLKERIKNG